MIIHCEQCQTKFLVKPESIGTSGRKVKCARCGHIWYQMLLLPPPAIEETSSFPPPLKPIVKAATIPIIEEETSVTAFEKIIPVIFVILIIMIIPFLYADIITYHYPQASEIYKIIGLNPSQGVMIEEATLQPVHKEGSTLWRIDGKLVNYADSLRTVPHVQVTIVNSDRKPINQLTLTSAGESMPPGESFSFSYVLPLLPEHARYLTIDVGNSLELLLRKPFKE